MIPCGGECIERAGYVPHGRQIHTMMANPMAAALVSGSFDPVRVAHQGNNLAEEAW